MDALELLTMQHLEVMHLFEKLERHPEINAKSSIFEQIADDLAVHMTLVERVFNPTAYEEETKRCHQAADEHEAIKSLLTESMRLSRKSSRFDAVVKMLMDEVQRHVRREESELFPEVRERLADVSREELGAEMQALFLYEMSRRPGRRFADRQARTSGSR